jgi:hypothetical protein
MKDASDRVSLSLVRYVFKYTPDLLAALEATRSASTVLPNGREVLMNKFAPMGSSLCFPVEAFVFWALGVASIIYDTTRNDIGFKALRRYASGNRWHDHLEMDFSPTRLILRRTMCAKLHVYGDDIIVAKKFHETLLEYLPKFGLKLNVDKCCIHGSFRESCGVDAYSGINVTPLRLKRRWCHRTVDASTLASYVKFSNLAYARGYKRVAAFAASLVEEKIGMLPITNRDMSMISFVRPSSVIQIPNSVPRRFNKKLQGMEYKVWTIRPSHCETDPDSWCMVLRTQSSKLDLLEEELTEAEIAQSGTPAGVLALTRRSCLKRVWTRLE